jgi:acetaldehyde dehydrogenase (acetylating)
MALANILFSPTGVINPRSVGQTPQTLAQMAGIQIPAQAKILVAPLSKVGKDEPLSREKLTTVLGWYEADGWEAGCERCIELIRFGGRGHTLVIHATDENVILQFGLEKPVFRILVNTMGTLGSVGLTTKLMPSMTLGSGGIGGSISGDNITTTHLMNIKRVAYETSAPPAEAMIDAVLGGQGGSVRRKSRPLSGR